MGFIGCSDGERAEARKHTPGCLPVSFPRQLWLPSFHYQQQHITAAFWYWNYICRNWRRNKEGDNLGVQGLQTPVGSQRSLHHTQAGPHAQKGPSLGLMLCCCHLQIINNRWMEDPHFYWPGPGEWCSWPFIQGKPASCRILPWFMSSPSLETRCYLSKIRDMQNHRTLDLQGTLKHCAPCSWGRWSAKRESVFALFYCLSSLTASLWNKAITLPLLFTVIWLCFSHYIYWSKYLVFLFFF